MRSRTGLFKKPVERVAMLWVLLRTQSGSNPVARVDMEPLVSSSNSCMCLGWSSFTSIMRGEPNSKRRLAVSWGWDLWWVITAFPRMVCEPEGQDPSHYLWHSPIWGKKVVINLHVSRSFGHEMSNVLLHLSAKHPLFPSRRKVLRFNFVISKFGKSCQSAMLLS